TPELYVPTTPITVASAASRPAAASPVAALDESLRASTSNLQPGTAWRRFASSTATRTEFRMPRPNWTRPASRGATTPILATCTLEELPPHAAVSSVTRHRPTPPRRTLRCHHRFRLAVVRIAVKLQATRR